MGRVNHKEDEIKGIATMILTSENYEQMIQKLNGLRMGLTNKYGKGKRVDTWKTLVELYK